MATYSTADCAAHLAQYNAAQPTTHSQVLSLDEKIDALKAALIVAKAENDQATIDRLRNEWAEITAEIEAAEAAELPFVPTLREVATVADVLDSLTIAADQVRSEAAPEWTSALDAGWSWLLTQDIFQIDAHGSLLVPSSRNPETIYRANGVCQCEAYTKSNTPHPCYHRAAGHIIERWRENEVIDQWAIVSEYGNAT